MLRYFMRRLIYMVSTLVFVSVVTFILIQLPPGDFITTIQAQRDTGGGQDVMSPEEVAALRRQYGLDRPFPAQYLKWVWNIVSRGDLGFSMQWNRPVNELIGERIALTTIMAMMTTLFIYAVAIPLGVYSALHQYSPGDFAFTALGYAGLATPNFMLALILMFIGFRYFGASVGGLFSPQYLEAPWSIAKVGDLLAHLWIPVIVLGTAGTAEQIRITRAMLLDELGKQYVITARAKGLSERRLIFKYPVRIALNPIVSTLGWSLTMVISGAPIVAVVLSLPTTGPILLRSLLSQDMFLAGSFILLLSVLTIVGTFVSDILLALLDPRIRMEGD